jgi:hypothetical protein
MAGLLDYGAFGTGSPAETAQQPSGLDALLRGAYNSLGLLAQQAFGASEEMRRGGAYNPAPAVEAAMLPMGTGAIVGAPVRGAETVLGTGVRPYQNVPDSLMGYRKAGPQTGFDASNYPHTQRVEVVLPNGKAPPDIFVDEIKGMNADHALERAWRNWPNAMNIRATQ